MRHLTKAQREVFDRLKAEGRIQNEKICGCFDVRMVENVSPGVTLSKLITLRCPACRILYRTTTTRT